MSGRRPARARLDLLHAERDLIVVNKPAGLLTMPTAPGRAEHEDSLLARARDYARHTRGRQAYVGLLHRLDRGTSGALAIALSREVHGEGRLLFRAHRFERCYLAIVRGAPAADEGTIDRPISAEYQDGRRALAGSGENALPARTHYRVRERFGAAAALVEVTLETGRTHQIRVHLAAQGQPIAGDDKYGDFELNKRLAKAGLKRMFLHAWRLRITHPRTGEPLALLSELPAELASWLAT